MIKVIAIILSIVISVVLIGSIGYMIVGSVINLINGQAVGDAIATAWSNYTNFVLGLFGKAHAEPDITFEFTNKCIDVVGCTSL